MENQYNILMKDTGKGLIHVLTPLAPLSPPVGGKREVSHCKLIVSPSLRSREGD
jgi:hypothetical protein